MQALRATLVACACLAAPLPSPGQPSAPVAWSSAVLVAPSEQAFGAAYGPLVCFLTTHGRVGCSEDEGSTWAPLVTLQGPITPLLERPLHVQGDIVAVFGARPDKTIADWCCPRPVGPYWLWVSTNRGRTFGAPIPISASVGAALRGSVWVEGNSIHMTWMDWRNAPMPLGKGTWDVHYRRWANGVLGPDVVLATGTTDVGADRPSIAAGGTAVQAVWMDGRDNLPACQIEGGTVLPQCTEIYGARSLDGGVTWEPARRLTTDVPYSGRPTIARDGATTLVTYDHRVVGGRNDIAVLRSTDTMNTWTQAFVTQAPGDQSHNSLAISAAEAHAIWIGPSGSTSLDAGVTWSAPEKIAHGPSVPSVGLSANYVHVFYSAYPSLYHTRKARTSAARVAQ